ncbi:hypothetical protein [Ideonella sp.]|jgi:hypothetical protein|uniref:hypothetical protein n=1 Tax=Ideonella sp. TaxID=1929293 RepID=UPI0037BEC535
MPLQIQDPTNPDSDYLVDVLLDACRDATIGGGAFAFLSAGGVQLLLKDEIFKDFLARGRFDLLVGVDAITDTAAIDALSTVRREHPSIGARVFVPSHPRSIFHPKVAWFDSGNGGLLVTGSGNLTAGGLRWNIEAFAVEHLDAPAMADLRSRWDEYLALTAECQLEPEDGRVVALLERNAARRRAMTEANITTPGEGGEEPPQEAPVVARECELAEPPAGQPADELPTIGPATEILVAEIPRASNRWGQANFDQATFFGFFGASRTVKRRAYFFHLRADGTLGFQEVRPAVAVQSKNYRFELEAASGLAYPADGRPIGVFAKVGARTFVYMLLMPNHAGHQEMVNLLARSALVGGGTLKRIVFPAAKVLAEWPLAPLWRRLTV